MTDLGRSRSGPKESDNRDKSLHGLMVALAMAGIIAGSVILFAYASSDSSVPDGTASAVNEVAPQPEPIPVIAEGVVDEPVEELGLAEKIEYVGITAEVKEPVYFNTTTEVKDEVQAYVEEAEEEPANETEDEEPAPSAPAPSDEEEEKDNDLPDEQESDDVLKLLLTEIVDFGEDEDDDKDEKEDRDDDGRNKGKGHKHDKDDDDD